MREQADRARDARESAQRARDLRDMAERLTEGATRGSEELAERWGDVAGDAPATPQEVRPREPAVEPTEFVDARPRGPAPEPGEQDRIAAEWFNPRPVPPGEAGTSARESPLEQITRARESAERAIEQQVVPRRHSELVRRVFGRYLGRAQGAAAPAPIPDAQDAGGR